MYYSFIVLISKINSIQTWLSHSTALWYYERFFGSSADPCDHKQSGYACIPPSCSAWNAERTFRGCIHTRWEKIPGAYGQHRTAVCNQKPSPCSYPGDLQETHPPVIERQHPPPGRDRYRTGFRMDRNFCFYSRKLFLLYMHFPKCTIVLFFNKNYFYAILQLFNFYINIFNYYINIINFNIDIYKF